MIRSRSVVALVVGLVFLFGLVGATDARKGSGHHGGKNGYHSSSSRGHGMSHYKSSSGHVSRARSSVAVQRDHHGKIQRSQAAKKTFLKSQGLKRVPPGYEVDHKVPLHAGGKDSPENMQLISKQAQRAKTKADKRKYGG